MQTADFFGLQDKKVVITGSSGGVGSACARLFALTAGAHVVLLARSDCSALVTEIHDAGAQAWYYPTDVADRGALDGSFNAIHKQHGSIDVLLNIAGACEFYGADETPLDKTVIDDARWERMLAANGRGVVHTIEYAVKMMSRGGNIVNVGSSAGRYGAEMAVIDYSFAKAGIVGLTMGYAKILAPLGIRVNAVAPGAIEGTAMLAKATSTSLEEMRARNRLGILCQPIDVAKIILFLASTMSTVMTGETIDANAGQFISF
jgi:NAD(P)-dependent dehydrogenase (short-subunit alcohol dehydrogenase family)